MIESKVSIITSMSNIALHNLSSAHQSPRTFDVILSIRLIQYSIPIHHFLISIFVAERVEDTEVRLRTLRKPVSC